MAHVLFGDHVLSVNLSTEQRPAEFRTPLYVVLAIPLCMIRARDEQNISSNNIAV